MPVDLSNLPRDENGIVQGVWRVLHERETFCGDIGVVPVLHGVGQWPVSGRALASLVAEFGHEVYLEPWGELPHGYEPGELVEASIDWWTPEPCPWRKAAPKAVAKTEPVAAPVVAPDPEPVAEATPEPAPMAEAFDIDAADADALRAHCEASGIDYDGRWGARRLRREIRKHGS